MDENGHELGWDDEISQESSFVLLDEGEYDFVIDHYARGRHSGSDKMPPCNKATVFFKIRDGDQETTISENFFLHSKMEWKLSELFLSVGLKKKDEPLHMEWEKLPGLTGRCEIIQVPGYKDETKKFNQIRKLLPKAAKKWKAGGF